MRPIYQPNSVQAAGEAVLLKDVYISMQSQLDAFVARLHSGVYLDHRPVWHLIHQLDIHGLEAGISDEDMNEIPEDIVDAIQFILFQTTQL
jgi:hypothetical protein